MKLVEIKCQRCNSVLEVPDGANSIKCKYCGAKYILDDETVHHKVDNPEEIGYQMEMGRQRAKRDIEKANKPDWREQATTIKKKENPLRNDQSDETLKNLGKILLWVFFLPIMFSIWVIKRKDAPVYAKIVIVILILIFCAVCMS